MGDDTVRKSKRAAARAWLERVCDTAAPVRADLDTVERVMEEEEAAGDEEEASKPAAAQRRALADCEVPGLEGRAHPCAVAPPPAACHLLYDLRSCEINIYIFRITGMNPQTSEMPASCVRRTA